MSSDSLVFSLGMPACFKWLSRNPFSSDLSRVAAMVADEKTPLIKNSISKASNKERSEEYTAVQTHSDLFRLIEKSRFFKNPSSDDIKLSQETDYPISYNQV